MSRYESLLASLSRALTTDFCPRANRWVYWLKNPFWLLVLATAASAICGIVLNPLVFVLTAILVVVTIIGTALPASMVRGTDIRVAFESARCSVGETTRIRLTICNRLPIPVCGLTLVRGFVRGHDQEGDSTDAGVSLARVPMRSTVDVIWHFTPRHRGCYPTEPPRVETSFPFGLFRASCPVDVSGSLTVWPQTVELDGIPDGSAIRFSHDRFSDRREGDFGDAVGTREFRSGDSLRRIHWAQTARHQRLITIQRQAQETSLVVVNADFSQEPGSHASEQSDESVIRAVASICRSLHRQHARVVLHLNGESISGDTSISGLNRMMDALATVQPERRSAAERVSQETTCTVTVTSQLKSGTPGRWLLVDADGEFQTQLPNEWRRICHV
jgi:uncharacterized protein (DUF58 family)